MMNLADALKKVAISPYPDENEALSSFEAAQTYIKEYKEAYAIIEAYIEGFSALTPSPGKSGQAQNKPTWAKWFTIDANGTGVWHKSKPNISADDVSWGRTWCEPTHFVDIPPGIDWRECIWDVSKPKE